MIPQVVKKIDISKLRIKKYVDWEHPQVSTKTLAELNITEDEPFQIIDEGGDLNGKFAVVREFWVRDWQTFYIITEKQAEIYFTNLFKASEKKKEYMIMEKKYEFTPQLAFANIETHMKTWAWQTNAKNFVVGISGGKDSTVVAMLLCAIFGKDRVYGVMMPQGEQSDIQDSIDVCNILGIRHTTVNIGGSVSAITDEIYKNRSKSGIYPTKDMDINLPARIRMSTLHAIGQCVDGRVINTSNLSEDMVGYATQFGDNAGAYAPLQGLTVTEVKELGKYLIDVLGIDDKEYSAPALNRYVSIPYKKRLIELVDKTPVDGLQAQTDEQRLGFTYDDLDKFIRLNEGSDEFKALIRKKYQQNKFKLEIVQMPQPDFSYLPNFVKD
ncbi:MAG: NAD(+) synthase [Paludibacteraceae bacterium]|nr:NAD(+) synthase [Paludibacteraceae bacterium]